MSTRTARTLRTSSPTAAAKVRRYARRDVSAPCAVVRSGDPAGGRAGARVPRPRDGRGARGGRQAAAAPAVALAAPVGRGDAPVLQLVRPARPARPQRLPDLRPPDVRPAARRGGVTVMRGR